MSSVLHSPDTFGQDAKKAQLWNAFLQPKSSAEFLSAWLGLLCTQIEGTLSGVLLLRTADGESFAPIALWPERPRDLSHLGEVAQQALGETRGIHRRAQDGTIQIAYPVGQGNHAGAVVLELSARADTFVPGALRAIHWGTGSLQDFFARDAIANIEQKTARIGSVMEVAATSLKQAPLKETLFALTDQLNKQLECARVVMGWTERARVRIAAMSDAAWFENNSLGTKQYAAAMEEALDRGERVLFSASESADDPRLAAHAELARITKAGSVLTLPLALQGKDLAVLTFERPVGRPFNQQDQEWLEALAAVLPAILDNKRAAQRSFIALLRDDLRTIAAKLFGPRHLVWKFCASILVGLAALLTFVHLDYRVTAKTVIEGEIQRAAVAPFDGFLASANVRAGDIVREGQLLCTLDDRDLMLERDRWNSEKEQRVRELREAMAVHELTKVQVVSAQLQQAEAQLALTLEQIRRSRILAPFDGVVISGDLNQLIGSPLEKGKKLFEIAPLTQYRVILQIDESELRHVAVGQSGGLLITGIAAEPLDIVVSRITPVATAKDGRNYFRVEAQLKAASAQLRPGMEGVGKVSVGDRRLWWILTHSFTDWVRIKLWKWLP